MDSDGSLRPRIERWLEADGWSLAVTEAPDADWLLVAVHPSQIRIQIGQKEDRPDTLILQASVSLSDDHRERLAALPVSQRGGLLWDLRIDLLRSGVEFDGLGEPLDRVRLHRRLFVEDLDRTALMDAVDRLRHLVLLLITRVTRALAEPGAAPGSEPIVH